MAINGFDRDRFISRLHEVVSPSRPIASLEHLIGRSVELDRIDKALLAPGRSIFIFGERGVGKSSLAATAANLYQSSDSDYIDVSCSPDSTISSIVTNIASQAIKKSRLNPTKTAHTARVNFSWLTYKIQTEGVPVDFNSLIKTTDDAVSVLKEVSNIHSENPVIVVDEVDRLRNETELDKFADLLKQIGDKRIDLKFIFTGVGHSLEEILGAHDSAIRQLETIELPRLSWDGRWDIAIKALAAFNIVIPDSIYIRLAAVSDGYPFYVHLVVEKLLWILFEKEEHVEKVSWDDYFQALNEAIVSISPELARPYAKATESRSPDYEDVVWSTSADEWQGAHIGTMYWIYEYIMRQKGRSEYLSYSQFSNRIRNLKKEQYGKILVQRRDRGEYHYNEKMLRGYIRMQAEANGISLYIEENEKQSKQYLKVPSKKHGYHIGSGAPSGYRSAWEQINRSKILKT